MNIDHRIHLCLAKMSPTGAEQKYINEAFASNWIAPLGPNVDAFEEALARHFDRSGMKWNGAEKSHSIEGDFSTPLCFARNDVYVAVLSSCTAAIHLALLLLGVGKDDEVLCQSFSFCASSNPVTYCGAKPIFVD